VGHDETVARFTPPTHNKKAMHTEIEEGIGQNFILFAISLTIYLKGDGNSKISSPYINDSLFIA